MKRVILFSGLYVFLLIIGACQREPRKACNPPCLHNAPCVEGVCNCPFPYEGGYCEKDARDRFVGTWEGRRRCRDVRSGLRYRLWKDDSLLFYLFIAGSFQGSAEETLQAQIVDPFRIQLSLQTLRDTPVFISGFGERRQDSLYLTLQLQSGAHQVDTCTWELKQR